MNYVSYIRLDSNSTIEKHSIQKNLPYTTTSTHGIIVLTVVLLGDQDGLGDNFFGTLISK